MKLDSICVDRLDLPGCRRVAELFEQSGILLLQVPRMDLESFEALTRSICSDFHQVGTRQALKVAQGDGFTTEVFRENFTLLGHAEGCYRPFPPPPDTCFFYCVHPPDLAGGETTVIDGAAMLAEIPARLRQRLEREGVIYEGVWQKPRWQVEFGVDDRQQLEALLSSREDMSLRWQGDTLYWRYTAPAIGLSKSGIPVFANGMMTHFPKIDHPRYRELPVYARPENHLYFGNGEPFTSDDISALIDAHDGVLYKHRWQSGEVLILDNTRYMHGRTMTVEPCKRMIISRFGNQRSANREMAG